MRSTCRRNHYIRFVGSLYIVFEINSYTLEFVGQLNCSFIITVGHKNRFHAISNKVSGCKFTHLSGTDQQNIRRRQIPKSFFRHFYGGETYRYRAVGNMGHSSHLFTDRNRSVKQSVQYGTGTICVTCQRICSFYLTENLSLPYDEGVQAGGDSK